MRTLTFCACLSLGFVSACSQKPTDPATPGGAPAMNQAVASHEPIGGGAPAAAGTAEGTVLETMDAANYTYVRVKTATDEFWAATLTFKVAVGDKVVVPLENPMRQFHSTSLKRDFPLIYFASDITHAGEPRPASSTPAPASAAPDQVIEPVAAAPGGMSIADLWKNRKALVGKSVTLRGKVVKFNPSIMGLNWTHVQDGSGSAKDGTHDITITSAGPANVGDVVTVTGTVVLDKDFGAGYSYVVMLQNATITVK